jgi:hypothetical protein
VPSVATIDTVRIVLDEASFDFRGLSDTEIEQHLDDLNRALLVLRGGVACAPMWDGFECLDSCELYRFLTGERPSTVARDTRILSYTLLDRCVEWNPDVPQLDTTVTIGDGKPTMALSVGYALAMWLTGFGVACLVFPRVTQRGFVAVGGSRGSHEVFFFADPLELPAFWRLLFAFESVPEHKFFELAKVAFPELVFYPPLSFRQFEGAYLDVRDRVVTILGGLNDYFCSEYREQKGLPANIQAAMGRHHVDLSPESPRTRGSTALMREREVVYNGQTFVCEWHAKLERHRNRIHFSEPSDSLDGKILIGKFTSHLT